jgi:hypothetical protein
MTSLWRKRKTSDKVATDVHHNEQKQDTLSNPLDLLHEENVRLGLYDGVYDLSIQSKDLSMQSNMMWVDPPEGWKFGFPAIYDPEKDGQMSEWIVRKGYPLLTIKEYGESWAVRCWPVEVKPFDESD